MMCRGGSPTRWNREFQMMEKQCGQCKEWLPATGEFFYKRGVKRQDGLRTLQSPCKVCIQTRRFETNAVEPCCVPGCDRPRRVNGRGVHRFSRCEEHDRALYEQRRVAG